MAITVRDRRIVRRRNALSSYRRSLLPIVTTDDVASSLLQLVVLGRHQRSGVSSVVHAPPLHWSDRVLNSSGTTVVRGGMSQRRPLKPRQQVRGESGVHVSVHEAVDGEVEAGVQVRDHRRVQVNGQRQAVGAVAQQDQRVRGPAADERHEDDENRLHLANGVHRRLVTRQVSLLRAMSTTTHTHAHARTHTH